MSKKEKPERSENAVQAALETTLSVIGGKWKSVILYQLLDGKKRFNELNKNIPKITKRMLTLSLRELEEDGIVRRKVYAEVPPRVEYNLTDLGKTVEEVLQAFRSWGKTYQKSAKGNDSTDQTEDES